MSEKKRLGKGKIALIVIASIVVAVLIVAGTCAIFAHSGKSDVNPTPFFSDWMSYISDDVLLKEIVIPGSHDAGTKGMAWVAETQDTTFTKMLNAGTRYFDIRVQKKKDNYYIFHGIAKGMEFLPIMDEILNFITEHPTETLILDFQHFKGDSQNDVANIIEKKLGDKLLKNDGELSDVDFIDGLTLNDVRGKCIAFWGSEDSNLEKDFLFLRNNDEGTRANSALQSFYISKYNKKSSKKYIEQGLPKYLEMRSEQPKGLFVLQGQLTDGALLFGPRFRERTHDKRMNEYVNSLADSSELAKINIIMRDYVNAEKNALILKLNLSKNTVKADARSFFAAELNKIA